MVNIGIKILFIFLLLNRIYMFFKNSKKSIEEQIEDIEEKIKFIPDDLRGLALGITKVIAGIAMIVSVLLLIYSVQILHYGWMSIIPIGCFMVLNCDLTVFYAVTIKELLHKTRMKNTKLWRVAYLIAAMIWYGMMIVLP